MIFEDDKNQQTQNEVGQALWDQKLIQVRKLLEPLFTQRIDLPLVSLAIFFLLFAPTNQWKQRAKFFLIWNVY